jgi:hypothetical protein
LYMAFMAAMRRAKDGFMAGMVALSERGGG